MSNSPYFKLLGQQPGVQIDLQSRESESSGVPADQFVAMASRLHRGPIDRAFLVTRETAMQRAGRVQSNLVRPAFEARMQLSDVLDSGAAGVVVSRLASGAARKRYVGVDLEGLAVVPAVVASVVGPTSVNEGATATLTVQMSGGGGASWVPFGISGVSLLDIGVPVFGGGVTLSGGELSVPAGVSTFSISIPVLADLTTEGAETMTVSVGGISRSISINDTSLSAPPPTFVYNVSAPMGWQHPTNAYNVPYITHQGGSLLMHPGPNLERPIVAFTNTFGAGTYRVVATTPPDDQSDSNSIAVVRAGVVIGGASWPGAFDQSLSLSAGETIEVALVGGQYNGGGRYVTIEVFKLLPSGYVKVADGYNDFIASSGAPTATWAYFYRSNSGYPSGVINSAGPMTPIGGGPVPVSGVQSVSAVSATVAEGETAVFTVTMDGYNGASSLPFAIGGTVIGSDLDAPVFSEGVSLLSGSVLSVMYGMTTFTISIPVLIDSATDDLEVLTVSVGGVTASVTISDVPAPVAPSSYLLRMPFDGANGSTVFTDAGSNGIELTTVGSLQISTAQSVSGGSSLLCAGAGHLIGSHPSIAFGVGDFTIRCRVMSTSGSNNGSERGVFQFCTPGGLGASNAGNIALFATNTGWAFYRGMTPHTIIGPAPVVDVWYRIAISRKASVMRIFINGVKVSEFVNSHNFINSGFVVGCYYSLGYRWYGHIDELEVLSNGIEEDV